jgi:predicted component of type VI protein secretion system
LPQIILCWAMEPLLQVLCVINAAWLLCTGTNHQGMFDLLMGIVRWRYRVAVYVSLMRDEYPPFRLDLGKHNAS